MQIVYVTPSGIPSKQANTIQVMKMCEAFSQANHDVTLLYPDCSKRSEDDIHSFYDVDPTFELQEVSWNPLKEYQFTVLAALYAYRKGADLVYARSIASCYFCSLLGIDVVYESHVPADNIRPITTQMFQSLLTKSNLISLVVISEKLKDYYKAKYDIDSRILVAHDAATRQNGSKIEHIQKASGQQVGYVGHLYEGKGIELIVKLAREVPEATFHIVGGTEKDLNKWQSETDNVSNIVFHGFVQPGEVADYLKSFDTVIAPYQNEVHGAGGGTNLSRWMSPLKIFEYMSAEKPIVCSDLPVLREILTNRENALLRQPNDVAGWADALRELQRNDTLRQKLVANARRDFETQHSYEARAKAILEDISDN